MNRNLIATTLTAALAAFMAAAALPTSAMAAESVIVNSGGMPSSDDWLILRSSPRAAQVQAPVQATASAAAQPGPVANTPLTRAEVIADLEEARRMGEIPSGDDWRLPREQHPKAYPLHPAQGVAGVNAAAAKAAR